jgi:predicted MFS family arabinose efflux permease
VTVLARSDVIEDSDRSGLRRSLRALNWANFFLADLQSGLGPFLGIYLVNLPGWDAEDIGWVLALNGLAGLALSALAGALIDITRRKRLLMATAAGLTSLGTLLITLRPTFPVVAFSQLLTGVAAVVLLPVTAALALGLVGPERYAAQTGRMNAYNHAGNVVGAAVVGVVGYLAGLRFGFLLSALFGVAVMAAVAVIRPGLIRHDVARGLDNQEGAPTQPSKLRTLLRNRSLLAFAAAVCLWQMANAAMLPLASQKFALGNSHQGALFLGALVVVAQATMVPMALLVSRAADRLGRKPLLVVAFLVLPIRGAMLALTRHAGPILAIEVLDGVGAGLLEPLLAIVVADLTRGTGRYNIAFGTVTMIQGIGVALSFSLAGADVVVAGYPAAMFTLAGIASVALLVLLVGVPETARRAEPQRRLISALPNRWNLVR